MQVKKSLPGWSWTTLDGAAMLESSSSRSSREGKSEANQSKMVSSRTQMDSSRTLPSSSSKIQARGSRVQEATGSSSRVQANSSSQTLPIRREAEKVGSRE